MDIREIIYINAIANLGNLNKAADHLHISQPSLSQSLSHTEAKLGIKLFTRSKKGMHLTQEGNRFIQDAQVLLTTYYDFMNKVNGYKDQGTTRHIGLYKLAYTTPVNRAIMQYMAQNTTDTYMIKVEGISDLENMVLSGKLDLAIIKYTPIHKRSNQLVYDLLFNERLYVLLNKNHPLAGKKVVSIKDLKGNRLISSAPNEYPHQMTNHILKEAGVNLDIHTQTNYENLSMIINLVSQNFGITFATHHVCNHFQNDQVVKVALKEPYDYQVCIVRRAGEDVAVELVEFLKKTNPLSPNT